MLYYNGINEFLNISIKILSSQIFLIVLRLFMNVFITLNMTIEISLVSGLQRADHFYLNHSIQSWSILFTYLENGTKQTYASYDYKFGASWPALFALGWYENRQEENSMLEANQKFNCYCVLLVFSVFQWH